MFVNEYWVYYLCNFKGKKTKKAKVVVFAFTNERIWTRI